MQVSFYATLRAIVGQKTVEVPLASGARILDLARDLAERYPELAEPLFGDDPTRSHLARSVHLMVDGRNQRFLPEGVETVLRADHTVDVFPPAAGG